MGLINFLHHLQWWSLAWVSYSLQCCLFLYHTVLGKEYLVINLLGRYICLKGISSARSVKMADESRYKRVLCLALLDSKPDTFCSAPERSSRLWRVGLWGPYMNVNDQPNLWRYFRCYLLQKTNTKYHEVFIKC